MFNRESGFKAFESKVWLSSPTMHGPEIEYVKEAYETNWMSTVGQNINEVERIACEKTGCHYAVALSAGTAGKIGEIKEVCDRHGATIIEDAAESFGATYKGVQTGIFGTYNCISFNGNKIITGSSGGMLLTDDKEAAEKVQKFHEDEWLYIGCIHRGSWSRRGTGYRMPPFLYRSNSSRK